MLRTQSWTYCTDKQWFINNAYIEIWEELYVFNADIYKKNRLARFARSQFCLHFLHFPTRRHSIRPYIMAGPWTPPVWEESHVSDTHTQLDCSQSFIITFSRVSGRYVKHFSDAKVHKYWLARYHFSQVSCVLVSIINKTISRVLRTQSCTYCTDKQWFINNVYIEIWEVCFKRRYIF